MSPCLWYSSIACVAEYTPCWALEGIVVGTKQGIDDSEWSVERFDRINDNVC